MTCPTRRQLLLGAGALTACHPPLAKHFNGYAFVANQGSRSISILNLWRFQTIKHLPLDGEPSQVIAGGDPQRAFALIPSGATAIELDPATLSATRRVRAGSTAVSARLSSDGQWLWILCRDPQAIVPVNLKTFQKGAPLKLPAQPLAFDLEAGGRLAAVSLPSRKAVCLANLATGRIEHEIELGVEPGIVRFRPDGKQVLIGIPGTHSIIVADSATGRVLVTLPLGLAPEQFCFTTDNGGQMFVSGKGMDGVAIVSPYQTAVSETILAGHEPGSMTASDTLLFVANPPVGDVTVISIVDRLVMAKIATGEEPVEIALTPDNQYALVLNRKSSDVAVVRLSKITDFRYKRAPLFTVAPVGERPVSLAVCQLV